MSAAAPLPTKPTPLPSTVRVRQVADHLGVHEVTVRQWIKQGKLDVLRIGRHVFITRESLAKLMGIEK